MSKPPPGWSRISSALFYQDPAAAIDWLEKAFGFATRVKIEGPDGQIVHSELELGDDGVVMVAGLNGGMEGAVSPDKIDGGFTQTLFVYVDDVDSHCQHSLDAGARLVRELTTADAPNVRRNKNNTMMARVAPSSRFCCTRSSAPWMYSTWSARISI